MPEQVAQRLYDDENSGFTKPEASGGQALEEMFGELSRMADQLTAGQAMDAESKEWITVNGAAIPLDKDGEPAGKVGKKIKAENPAKTSFKPSKLFDDYMREAGGNHVEAAKNFYRKELQGKSFSGDLGGEEPRKAQVVGGNWDEFRNHLRDNPIKAELISRIPEIIETGRFIGRLETPEHAKYQAFRTQFKEVETGGKRVKAMLDVGELNNSLFTYSLNHEGSPTWEARKRHMREMEEQGRLKGGTGTKMPSFDERSEEADVPAYFRGSPGISNQSLQQSPEKINLYILEVIDIATGKRMPEYEDKDGIRHYGYFEALGENGGTDERKS
jgi:hypothetical protein